MTSLVWLVLFVCMVMWLKIRRYVCLEEGKWYCRRLWKNKKSSFTRNKTVGGMLLQETNQGQNSVNLMWSEVFLTSLNWTVLFLFSNFNSFKNDLIYVLNVCYMCRNGSSFYQLNYSSIPSLGSLFILPSLYYHYAYRLCCFIMHTHQLSVFALSFNFPV